MAAERRETGYSVAQSTHQAEICSDGFLKGYRRLHWIAARAARHRKEKVHQLMHHLNAHNLLRAFHNLAGNKACGIDKVTKSGYKQDIQTNIDSLVARIQHKRWKPKPSREVLIPKPQGGFRPLAIGCLEDKIVQTLVARILEAVFEPLFHRASYGFRPGKSAHHAIRHVYSAISKYDKTCVVVEMDIEKFFNSMSHVFLLDLLKLKIADVHFLQLIEKMLKAQTLLSDGRLSDNVLGTPQGSPVSPVLANIYLHFLLDAWFLENFADKGEMIRYADDAVFVFRDNASAAEFSSALHERMKIGSLALNKDKSGSVIFNRHRPQGVVPFLGFEFHWGTAAVDKRMLKLKTSSKKLGKAVENFTDWVKASRHKMKTDALLRIAAAKVRRHFLYFGVVTNHVNLRNFHFAVTSALFQWLNRRSQKSSFDFDTFRKKLLLLAFPAPPYGHLLLDVTSVTSLAVKHSPSSRMRKLRTSGSTRSVGEFSSSAFT
jgi:group II intron reverse transcriptase/maturase